METSTLIAISVGLSAMVLLYYIILGAMIGYSAYLGWRIKQWDRQMENPPPPPKKKCSSCDGTGTMILDKTSLPLKIPCLKCVATGYINYGYQPDNKVDTSNPPKQTGT